MSEGCRIRQNYVHDMPYGAICSGGVRHRWFVGIPAPRPELQDLWRRRGAGRPTIPAVKAFIPGRNRIERNLVHDVMTRLDDGAAIYCHAGHHNVMRGKRDHVDRGRQRGRHVATRVGRTCQRAVDRVGEDRRARLGRRERRQRWREHRMPIGA
jgi:hypothetical protein